MKKLIILMIKIWVLMNKLLMNKYLKVNKTHKWKKVIIRLYNKNLFNINKNKNIINNINKVNMNAIKNKNKNSNW